MTKEPKTQQEIEEMLTAALKDRYPDWRAGIEPGDEGWQCYVVRTTPAVEQIMEGDRLLTDLLERYVIVDQEGREDPGKL